MLMCWGTTIIIFDDSSAIISLMQVLFIIFFVGRIHSNTLYYSSGLIWWATMKFLGADRNAGLQTLPRHMQSAAAAALLCRVGTKRWSIWAKTERPSSPRLRQLQLLPRRRLFCWGLTSGGVQPTTVSSKWFEVRLPFGDMLILADSKHGCGSVTRGAFAETMMVSTRVEAISFSIWIRRRKSPILVPPSERRRMGVESRLFFLR
jgi:hypothetical protein